MPLVDIPRAFQEGVGNTLGFVAMVIALGTVIGKLLAESGGAEVVSQALIGALVSGGWTGQCCCRLSHRPAGVLPGRPGAAGAGDVHHCRSDRDAAIRLASR